eukprot:TRINITY_DN8543_c0_g1_i1.p1 TRINITY_DN8543_c0_g1~~TRINITY_DN8543_c0_g1_i1.p1  ORF type:complete len:575 (-),score=179.88 TRINITY_DN8543_c0_g1_i1:15-1739(-)
MSNFKSGFGSLAGLVKEGIKDMKQQVNQMRSHGLPENLINEETDVLYGNYIHLGNIMTQLNTQIRENLTLAQKTTKSTQEVANFVYDESRLLGKVDIRDLTEKYTVVQSAATGSLLQEMIAKINSQLIAPIRQDLQNTDAETKHFIQQAQTYIQLSDHLEARNADREFVIANAVISVIKAQQAFYQELAKMYGDLSHSIEDTQKNVLASKNQKKVVKQQTTNGRPTTAPRNGSPQTEVKNSPQLPVKNTAVQQGTQPSPSPQKQQQQPSQQPQPRMASLSEMMFGDDPAPNVAQNSVPQQNNAPQQNNGANNNIFDLLGPDSTFQSNPTPAYFPPSNQTNNKNNQNMDFLGGGNNNNNKNVDLLGGGNADIFSLDMDSGPVMAPTKHLGLSNDLDFFNSPLTSTTSSPVVPRANQNDKKVNDAFSNDHEEDKPKQKYVDRRAKPAQPLSPQQQAAQIDKAASDFRNREQTQEAINEQKRLLDDIVSAKIEAWVGGRKNNLRSLLSTLHLVLWEGSGWEEMQMSSLIDQSALTKGYMKAQRIVHPDKIKPGLPLEQVMIAERVFHLLTEAKNASS